MASVACAPRSTITGRGAAILNCSCGRLFALEQLLSLEGSRRRCRPKVETKSFSRRSRSHLGFASSVWKVGFASYGRSRHMATGARSPPKTGRCCAPLVGAALSPLRTTPTPIPWHTVGAYDPQPCVAPSAPAAQVVRLGSHPELWRSTQKAKSVCAVTFETMVAVPEFDGCNQGYLQSQSATIARR